MTILEIVGVLVAVVLMFIGAVAVALTVGLWLVAKIASFLRRNLPRVLPITVCPTCGRWSPSWCNRTDWYGDGFDCDKKTFVRMNRDGSLRKPS